MVEINVAHTVRPLVLHLVHRVCLTFGGVDGPLLLLDADATICGVWLLSGLHREVLET